MKKRILSLLLALVLLLTALPQYLTPARAEDAPVYSGVCGAQGDNLTWSLDPDSGILTVRGSGDMADYDSDKEAPWADSMKKIKQIVLAEGVTGVGSRAFYWAEYAVSLSLPNSLTRIGESAFYYCMDLKEVTIPAGVKELPKAAFCNCFELERVALPEGLTAIGNSAFYGCFVLREINWPSTLLRIGDSAFIHADFKTVVLPDGLKDVGNNAFEYNNLLTAIRFPDSVERFGTSAVGSCSMLTDVRLPAGLTEIPNHCFMNCSSLESVAIPAGVTRIGDFAFNGCSRLWNLELPAGTAEIGSYAFSDCKWLMGITLPALSKIDFGAFEGCDILTGVVVLSSSTRFQSYREDLIFNGPENTTLYGYTGTSIESYAQKHGYPFVDWSTHTHSWHETVLEPSCTLGGYQVQVCDCGHIQSATPLKALGHCYRNGRCIRCDKSVPAEFSDVKEGAYYYDPVMWAVDNGITSGAGDGVFSPKKVCTREQVVTFLWKAAGSPRPESSQNPFTDVKSGKYYYNAVLWAVEKGITSGSSAAKFGVGKPCTREQVVSFLWKALGSPAPAGTESPFTDVKPGKYYFSPVLWAVEHGVSSGATPTTFGVGRPCTRAQVVTFLYNAYVLNG